MTRAILITGGKGGIGKTTLTANLSYSLAELGYDVIALDANLTTPNLGLHLGVPLARYNFHDFAKGRVDASEVIYSHPLGFKIVPASIATEDLQGVAPTKLFDLKLSLIGKADFLIMDSSAGLGREALTALEASDEVILVVNPELSSVVDALKTSKLAESLGKKVIGVVVNRYTKHGMRLDEIKKIMEKPILAVIPEDRRVYKSVQTRQPFVYLYPNSLPALEVKKLAHLLVGKQFDEKPAFLEKIISKLF